MDDVIEIDGSEGEGGGQIIRSALALSLVTGRPFAIRKIRAKRDKPGLKHQHLTACKAAARVGCAEITGAEVGSREMTFRPSGIYSGVYDFDVQTAGGTTLVAQTILPALMIADGPSSVTIDGGTHNTWAPPFDFLARVYLPLVCRLGPQVSATLVRYGFYPAGQGRIELNVQPANLRGFDLIERGKFLSRQVTAVVANLPLHIAEREADTAVRRLGWSANESSALEVPSSGPGNIVMIEHTCENVSEIATAIGRIGLPAERVAADAVRKMRNYLRHSDPVGEHLADQWMLPLAIAVAKTEIAHRFRTSKLSQHALTHLDIIKRFLPVQTFVETDADQSVVVRISPAKTKAEN
jgi:RNA 3'-terminal phosphate cyclase (ATP)